MSKSSFRVRKIVTLAILAALGSALMWVEIPFIPPFKFDISDTAVIIAMVLYGPIGGIAVALNKSLVHIVIISAGDFGVGEMIAFV
ncbi:MAG: ECF transporter S component, partial [Bacilli bacterium]|nr:ECF transporter S component [Bacilli bacterium]